MKTIEVQVYKFNELSEEAKERAISDCRNNSSDDYSWLYDEAHQSVKEFHKIFNTSEGYRSWLDVRVNYDDNILELTGQRLRTYILNNYGNDLFKPKYIGSLKSNEIKRHKRIKSKPLSNGNVFNPYYSAIQKDNCCVLTGVCYDDSLLKPIYDFIKKPDGCNIEDLIRFCFEELKNNIESEIDAMNEDSYIIEQIENNDYDFEEDGTIF